MAQPEYDLREAIQRAEAAKQEAFETVMELLRDDDFLGGLSATLTRYMGPAMAAVEMSEVAEFNSLEQPAMAFFDSHHGAVYRVWGYLSRNDVSWDRDADETYDTLLSGLYDHCITSGYTF